MVRMKGRACSVSQGDSRLCTVRMLVTICDSRGDKCDSFGGAHTCMHTPHARTHARTHADTHTHILYILLSLVIRLSSNTVNMSVVCDGFHNCLLPPCLRSTWKPR